jgi:hypothetical protein
LDIAELKEGEAIVHNKDIHQAFMVKIDEFNEEKISDDEIVKFYNNFIENNKNYKYKYELLFEDKFYIENGEKPDFSKINLDILKVKFVEFLNSIFFDSKNILENFECLYPNLKYIAGMNREADPLVATEAYWIGNDILKNTKTERQLVGLWS